jgi:NADH-quinone oxidoreductase subunit L
MTGIIEYSWLIPVLPIIAFAIIAFFGRKIYEGGAPVGILFTGASFIISLGTLLEVLHRTEPYTRSMEWFMGIKVGILIDPVGAIMLVIVSFISLLVQIYSIGYMHGDPGLPRYYAEMNLFTTSMLGFAISDSILFAFINWELVGLCSYLLIGFWYRKHSAAAAAKKAFLVTRVGDVFFFMGILILFTNLHTFNYLELFEKAEMGEIAVPLLTFAMLGIFGGAVGKSAQFPLHVWLPDAMEGPTTVSCLIHAATMVKAGVFLVARTYPLFHLTPDALTVVAYIGGFTAFLAASLAVVVTDIKRIVAYSTISQLGYMMLALGAGGYIAGMFHLMNHSFFKALLFLASGSVIHAVGTNDIRQMGGLLKYMKITAITMLFGVLSVSGIPPFSGFFSKDEVLLSAYNYYHATHHILPLLFGLVTAFLTAFYMCRAWFLAFTGTYRGGQIVKHLPAEAHAADHNGGEPKHVGHDVHIQIHESPWVMTIPLIILAFLALTSGWTWEGYRHVVTLPFLHEEEPAPVIMYTSVILAILGIAVAALLYYKFTISSSKIASAFKSIHTLLMNKYYLDHLYYGFAEKIVYGVARLAEFFDLYGIDGVVNAITAVIVRGAARLRKVQTGRVQGYASAVIIGVIVLLIIAFLGGR